MFLIYEVDVCVGEVDAVNQEQAIALAQQKWGYTENAPIFAQEQTLQRHYFMVSCKGKRYTGYGHCEKDAIDRFERHNKGKYICYCREKK